MTPSEKPERSEPQPEKDANRTSVITHKADGGATTSPAEHDGAPESAPADGNGEALDDLETPPPWQRASTASSSAQPDTDSGTADTSHVEETQTIPKPTQDPDTVRTATSGIQPGDSTDTASTQSERSSGPFAGNTATRSSSASGAGSSSRRPSRGPRRASLQVKRVDPWSVLKLALVLSVALFFVWMIAVAVLYGVLDGMGVWDQLNGTFTELTQSDNTATESLISAGRVFSVASIIGGINIVLFTALATVAAFIYNVAADFAGGVELTLSERE